MDIKPVTQTEGDLYDMGDTVHEVTKEALQEAMTEKEIVMGSLRAQLQELQVQLPQEGAVAAYNVASTLAAGQLLHAKLANTIVLLEGAVTTKNEDDRAAVGKINGLGLNLAARSWDTLYQLQDDIIVELRAREGHAIQVLSEYKINIEQLSL